MTNFSILFGIVYLIAPGSSLPGQYSIKMWYLRIREYWGNKGLRDEEGVIESIG